MGQECLPGQGPGPVLASLGQIPGPTTGLLTLQKMQKEEGEGETRNANIFTLKTLEDTEMITKWKLGKENPCGLTEIP